MVSALSMVDTSEISFVEKAYRFIILNSAFYANSSHLNNEKNNKFNLDYKVERI